jgi:hypothetical protein
MKMFIRIKNVKSKMKARWNVMTTEQDLLKDLGKGTPHLNKEKGMIGKMTGITRVKGVTTKKITTAGGSDA